MTIATRDIGAGAPLTGLGANIEAKLRYTLGKTPADAAPRDWYMALALAVRDRIVDRWMDTRARHDTARPKRAYYLSMEFLIGRLLTDSIANMGLMDEAQRALAGFGVDFEALRDVEPDAALGSGGLGRLAACFLESMATIGVAGMGYGIRYENGMLRQGLSDGWQVDLPDDWLDAGNPWEFERLDVAQDIGFGGHIERDWTCGEHVFRWVPAETVKAVAFDTPVVGFGGRTINTLRLWSARGQAPMRLDMFNRGEHVEAYTHQMRAQAISRVLYPDDTNPAGKELRLRQEYFFTAASLADLIDRHMKLDGDIRRLPQAAAIQLNDTHPALAVVELMRLLVDAHGLPLAEAFDLTRATLRYTNHTLLPEALEVWPVPLFERLLPRHMQMVRDVNALHLDSIAARGGGHDQLRATSLIDENHGRFVRMGHMAFVGSAHVNGVSGLHGELMRDTVFAELHREFPGRITHITNGITPRRWLQQCNPDLAALITEAIGEAWHADAERLAALAPLASDAAFATRFAAIKLRNKQRLAGMVARNTGLAFDPHAMVDIQIKRIHEYKRQLLNVLETVARYRAIKAEPGRDWTPRVKLFAGKSAASYVRAKLIIKLINDVAAVVNADAEVGDRLKVAFIPNYRVSLAEYLFPGADLSEQISTAGMEASGTGNMKFALNGAVTIGTMDGANIEISEQVGRDNMFIFGLSAGEVAAKRAAGYAPREAIAACPPLADALDALKRGDFSPGDPARYAGLVDDLSHFDFFMLCADYADYARAQALADATYADTAGWARLAVLNTAGMGWFSSDRAIREYATRIWQTPFGHG